MVRQSYFPADAHVKKNVDALVEAGYVVDVVCQREDGARAKESYAGGTIHRLPISHKRGNKLRYLFEYLAFFVMASVMVAYRSLRRRYDVIEVYNIPDFLVFAALPAKLRGSKVILYLFEMMPEQVAYEYGLTGSHPLIRVLRWLERRSVRFADSVVVVSLHQGEVVRMRSSPRAELVVCLNVPDEALFHPPVANCDRSHSPAFRVMTHGSILRRYGIDALIRATKHLKDELLPGLEVWIIGEGEHKPELMTLAAECGVQEEVKFYGWVPLEKVPDYIASADLGVVPASAGWLLPNKLFEYVAMNKPVVASTSPAVQAVFPSSAIAYIPPDDERALADKILELYHAPERIRCLTRNAAQTYQNYRWEVTKRAYVQAHNDLIS